MVVKDEETRLGKKQSGVVQEAQTMKKTIIWNRKKFLYKSDKFMLILKKNQDLKTRTWLFQSPAQSWGLKTLNKK